MLQQGAKLEPTLYVNGIDADPLKIKIQAEHDIVYMEIVSTRHVIVAFVILVIHPVIKTLFAIKDSFISSSPFFR